MYKRQGTTSTDENPWNGYGAAGEYEVTLVAMTNGCANDTTTMSIVVIDNSASINANLFDGVNIYPNPFENQIIINGTGMFSNLTVSIYDMTGRRVSTALVPEDADMVTIQGLSHLSQGVYNIILSSEEGEMSYKLVK